MLVCNVTYMATDYMVLVPVGILITDFSGLVNERKNTSREWVYTHMDQLLNKPWILSEATPRSFHSQPAEQVPYIVTNWCSILFLSKLCNADRSQPGSPVIHLPKLLMHLIPHFIFCCGCCFIPKIHWASVWKINDSSHL